MEGYRPDFALQLSVHVHPISCLCNAEIVAQITAFRTFLVVEASTPAALETGQATDAPTDSFPGLYDSRRSLVITLLVGLHGVEN